MRLRDAQPLISGNWKMHFNHFEAIQFVQKLSYLLDKDDLAGGRREHPPAVHRPALGADPARRRPHPLRPRRPALPLGGQGRLHRRGGAGRSWPSSTCAYVICGHSERRELFGETDEMVAAKVAAILANGMTPILCVGETLAEREAGGTEAKVVGQVRAALGGRTAEQVGGAGHRLRADLGDRHRSDGHPGRRPGGVRHHPRRGGQRLRRRTRRPPFGSSTAVRSRRPTSPT